MQSRVIRRQKKHNQTHVTLFQKPFGVSDFLKQTPNQTQTPSTKMISYRSVVQRVACGPHAARGQFLWGPRMLSVCRTLHSHKYIILATQSLQVTHH